MHMHGGPGRFHGGGPRGGGFGGPHGAPPHRGGRRPPGGFGHFGPPIPPRRPHYGGCLGCLTYVIGFVIIIALIISFIF